MSDSTVVNGTNATYNFYPQWVPAADDWNQMFGGKVDALGGFLTDPVVYGTMTLTQWPVTDNDATPKSYVDAVLGDSNSLPEAPADGVPYCRANHTWVPAPTTLTGSVTGDMNVGGNLSVGGTSILAGEVLIGTTVFSGYALDMVGALRTTGSATFGDVALAPRALIGPVTDAGYTLDVSGKSRIAIDGVTSCLTITSNSAAVPPPLLPSSTQLQFVGGDGLCSRTEYVTYGDMGILTFRKANGTGAAPTATAGNIFALIGQGYDGSAWTTSMRSAFYSIASGTWTPTSTPTWLSWWTTPVGATLCAERMRLQPSGNLSIGATADAGYKLDVSGNAHISSGLGVFGATPPATKPSFTGAKGGNTALASVIAILAAAGFGADTTTA